LKKDEDYESGEQGDPWEKIVFSEIKGQYYVVAVGKNENSFGIYADLIKIKQQIEGFPASLYESYDSYDQAHKYLEQYLHEDNGNETMEITATEFAAIKKKQVLGYEDLTKKKQDHARTLPKGMYIQNIMSKM
jgi:viroplasmin and RNaseH domain-containing protein